MIDADLADLYQVTTGNLDLAVKRDLNRFPEDFTFQLTGKAFETLRFQSAISNCGGRRYLCHAFTEHGVVTLSSVLPSKHAVQVNIAIMRAFVRLREMLAFHKDLARKLDEMEKKHAHQFKVAADGTNFTPPLSHGVRVRRRVAKVVTICDHLR